MQQNFPAVIGHLKLVKIECRKVIHKKALDLATEDENFGSKNV